MNNRQVAVRCALCWGVVALCLSGCDSGGGGSGRLDSGTATGGQTSTSAGGGSGGAASGGVGTGGTVGTGGVSASGGANATGGSPATGGSGTGGGTGGRSGTGGSTVPDAGPRDGATDGSATGGRTGTGGRSGTGGTTATGGAATGGTRVTGGATGTGGAAGTGGATATGGSGTGGSSGPCTPAWQDPPSTASQWIDASWSSQLGSNVKSRKDWLIDNVMLGQGQINLCVRWGATSAPSATVKANMAAAAEKWFNDWFANLDGYGCFPYSHVTVKVTGWAVKPGNESWVSDLDSSIKVYTQTDPGTDPPGEPKCPDACSFFTNWSHSFPSCPGGEAFHTDYWMWLDDNLPGSGAAAVGGDWGLRMPVSNFISSMGKSNLVIEHEMGHGFGFQDYYDWTGPTPTGGSLMIVGSTSSQTPTVADQWLLRRTWKEMKTLRGW